MYKSGTWDNSYQACDSDSFKGSDRDLGKWLVAFPVLLILVVTGLVVVDQALLAINLTSRIPGCFDKPGGAPCEQRGLPSCLAIIASSGSSLLLCLVHGDHLPPMNNFEIPTSFLNTR